MSEESKDNHTRPVQQGGGGGGGGGVTYKRTGKSVKTSLVKEQAPIDLNEWRPFFHRTGIDHLNPKTAKYDRTERIFIQEKTDGSPIAFVFPRALNGAVVFLHFDQLKTIESCSATTPWGKTMHAIVAKARAGGFLYDHVYHAESLADLRSVTVKYERTPPAFCIVFGIVETWIDDKTNKRVGRQLLPEEIAKACNDFGLWSARVYWDSKYDTSEEDMKRTIPEIGAEIIAGIERHVAAYVAEWKTAVAAKRQRQEMNKLKRAAKSSKHAEAAALDLVHKKRNIQEQPLKPASKPAATAVAAAAAAVKELKSPTTSQIRQPPPTPRHADKFYESLLGSANGPEGIVIKVYHKDGTFGRRKMVTEPHQEMARATKPEDPNANEDQLVQRIGALFDVEARLRKSVLRLSANDAEFERACDLCKHVMSSGRNDLKDAQYAGDAKFAATGGAEPKRPPLEELIAAGRAARDGQHYQYLALRNKPGLGAQEVPIVVDKDKLWERDTTPQFELRVPVVPDKDELWDRDTKPKCDVIVQDTSMWHRTIAGGTIVPIAWYHASQDGVVNQATAVRHDAVESVWLTFQSALLDEANRDLIKERRHDIGGMLMAEFASFFWRTVKSEWGRLQAQWIAEFDELKTAGLLEVTNLGEGKEKSVSTDCDRAVQVETSTFSTVGMAASLFGPRDEGDPVITSDDAPRVLFSQDMAHQVASTLGPRDEGDPVLSPQDTKAKKLTKQQEQEQRFLRVMRLATEWTSQYFARHRDFAADDKEDRLGLRLGTPPTESSLYFEVEQLLWDEFRIDVFEASTASMGDVFRTMLTEV